MTATSPIGRLFWKFFLAFWLALLVASAVVGGFLWLDAEATRQPGPHIDEGPVGRLLVDAAAVTAAHGGRDGLKAWLVDMEGSQEKRRLHVYAVDDKGRDLLGREVPIAAVAARARLAISGGDTASSHLALREVAVDGERLLLYVPAPPPIPGSPRPEDRAGPHGFRVPAWFVPLSTGLLASVVLAALLAWYFAHPIRALDEALKRAAQGDLAVRVSPRLGRRRDEIANLGREFDRMIRQIDGLLQSERRLLHDVSHEMRSPLARLQVCVGLARRDPAQASAMLDRIERETVQMDGLVEEILTLARLESGVVIEEPRERIELDGLLADAIEDARIEAEARGITVAFREGGNVFLTAHPGLLRRAFDNVIRNAVQHSPDGAVIDVAIERSADQIVVTVGDRGPGLSPEECMQVFEPFVRGRRRSSKGHGLGLAIARRALEANDSHIDARPREGGGLLVTVLLQGERA